MVQHAGNIARIPHGVADIFNEEAAAVTALERRLHDLILVGDMLGLSSNICLL